jgi:hypothetical protein
VPFKSESQRRYLWKFHPEVAKKWAHEHPGQKKLPRRKRKTDWKKERAKHG